MKKTLLIALLCFAAPSWALADTVKLPGNAHVVRPGSNNGGSYVIYDNDYDTDELIYRQILDPYADTEGSFHSFPKSEYSAICGNIDRQGQRRRCREDVMDNNKDRERLYRKYAD